jgi:hypothetical protein
MQTNQTTIKPRSKKGKGTKPTVFRTSEEVSDAVYEAFYSKAHRQRLAEGTPVWAHRLIRMESFTREELVGLETLINSAGQGSMTGQVLAAEVTLPWIRESLHPMGKAAAVAA